MNNNAVVTLCIGNQWDEMANLTHPTIKAYADKIHADFIVINIPFIQAKDEGFEKFQLAKILNSYDRVIYLDTDIIVTRRCPNLFEKVEKYDIGAFVESDYFTVSREVDHRQRIIELQKQLGNIGWVNQYINTGVMVLSKRHASIFEIPQNYVVDLREQSQLNYNIKKYGFWIQDLGIRFNKMDFINPLDRFESYIIHYAGRGFTPQWHNMKLKIARISKDIEALKELKYL